jgi:hypothetical protein
MGAIWTPANLGLTNTAVWSLALAETTLIAGTYGGGVFLSSDGGVSWSGPGDDLADSHVLSLAVDAPNVFAGTLEGVFRSTDAGCTWIPVNNGMTNLFVRTLAVHRGRIFAGTYGGGVFISTNSGVKWTAASDGLANASILNFAFLGSTVFAGTYGGVFCSNEDEIYWLPVSLDVANTGSTLSTRHVPGSAIGERGRDDSLLAPKAVYSLVVDGQDLYVGTYGRGTLRSTDAGGSWTPVNAGLENLDLSVISLYGTNLYAGTLSGEVWRLPLSQTLGIVERQAGTPTNFRLEQNYPNPFNPTTMVRYQVPVVSDVRLEVYDLPGRAVAVLVNETKAPGRYEVNFDARGLASGVYFCRLRAGAFVTTTRLIVLR